MGSDNVSLAISGNSKFVMWGTAWIYNMADSLGIWGFTPEDVKFVPKNNAKSIEFMIPI